MSVSKISIKDVAKHAGTSVGTVSNVLNHPERVSPRLLEKVQAAMAELQYLPNPTARALSIGKSHLIGTIFFDISNPFFSEAAHTIDRKLQEQKHAMILASTEQDMKEEARALRRLTRAGIDGLIICSAGGNWDQLNLLQNHGIPVMVMAQRSTNQQFASVGVNDFLGLKKITTYLIERGITKFCYVNEQIQAVQHLDRWRGHVAALTEKGFNPDEVRLEWSVGPTWSGGAAAATRVLSEDPKYWPEVFVCLNDYTALGVCKAITDHGLTVGKDICVTGFDNIPYAEITSVPLTTVHQPIDEICTFAVDQLTQAIKTGKNQLESLTLEPEVVIRQSA